MPNSPPLFNEPQSHNNLEWVAFFILFLGVVSTSVITLFLCIKIQQDTLKEFIRQCDQIEFKLNYEIQNNNTMLHSVAGFFTSTDNIYRQKLNVYSDKILLSENQSGIKNISFTKVIKQNQIESFEKDARAEGFSDFKIRPLENRETLTPIRYVIPENSENLAIMGFDTSSNAARRKAQDEARDSGEIAITEKVKILQSRNRQAKEGIVFIDPVYSKSKPINSIEQKRAALIGFVNMPYVIEDLFESGIFKPNELSPFHIQVYEKIIASPQTLIYENKDRPSYRQPSPLLQNRWITLSSNTQWLVKIDSAKIGPIYNFTTVISFLLFGLTASGLLFLIIRSQLKMKLSAQIMAYDLAKENRQLNQRLSLALNVARLGVWEYIPQTGELIWDEGQLELYGVEPNTFTGKVQFWEQWVHPDDRSAAAQAVNLALKDEKDFDTLFRIKTPKHEIRYIEGKAIVVRGSDDKPIRMIGVNYDVTERILSQKKLEHQIEMSQVANLAKDRFLAVMSHEIRTPLNGIIGISQMALNLNPSEVNNDLFTKILSSSKVLLKILNEVLDFSKIQNKKMELILDSFNIELLIEEAEWLFKPSANLKNIHLFIDHDQKIPMYLLGDKHRLQQIIHNLLDNAIKFTTSGEIILKTYLIEKFDQSAHFGVLIKDSGVGIPQKDISEIMYPFNQSIQPGISPVGGTGLGLSICQELLKLMDSTLVIHSDLGQGTMMQFDLKLPIMDANDSEVPKNKLNEPHISVNFIGRNLVGRNVLVVEDNAINAEVLKILMSTLKANLYLANNGEECLNLLSKNNIDIVLMDIQMPVLDGYETTRLIRLMPQYKHLPIIGVSAVSTSVNTENLSNLGMDRFILKPFDAIELVQCMMDLLESDPKS